MKISQLFCVLTALLSSPALFAASVSVAGLMNGKAIVSINGGSPRMMAVGQTLQDVKLLRADSQSATFEIDGKQQTLQMGKGFSGSNASGKATAILTAGSNGHFMTAGQINGMTTQMVVDTGASSVAMSASEARRLGILYRNGQPMATSTANGIVPAYRVVFDTVKVGDILLYHVEGSVIEGAGLPVTLLGMSFLSRVSMNREGSTMTLKKP